MSTALHGLGHFLPPLVERAGIRRPICEPAAGPSQLAIPAATQALQQAGIGVGDVDFIVFATMTPNVTFPGAGCYFQHEMGCGTVGALDVRAQCTGFLYGLTVADRFVRAGTYAHVLVIGAEVHSSGLDYSELGCEVARLYGDGAGVALLGNSQGGAQILSTVLHSDGRPHQQFWVEYPASRQHPVRMTIDDFRARKHFLSIDLPAVQGFIRKALPAAVTEAVQSAQLELSQVDHFVFSAVCPEAVREAAAQLGIPESRLSNPAARYGHLTAAALPVALSEDLAGGRIAAGATVCLAAAGAGFTWGAAVVRL